MISHEQALTLVGMLTDTVQAQQNAINSMGAEIQRLNALLSDDSDNSEELVNDNPGV